MLTCLGYVLALSLLGHLPGFGSLREAFTVAPDQPSQALPRDAVQFIVDTCHLGWTIDSPYALKDGAPLTAALSPQRDYCVLTRPYPCAGCEALPARSLWSTPLACVGAGQGTFLHPQLFRRAVTPRCSCKLERRLRIRRQLTSWCCPPSATPF